jgi:hypothetical protein
MALRAVAPGSHYDHPRELLAFRAQESLQGRRMTRARFFVKLRLQLIARQLL